MTKIFLKIIRFYQATISPDHGFIFAGGSMRCRFYPSCSQYTYEAIERWGVVKGVLKGLARILRCNPLSRGGIYEIR
ncbi:MAG: membrane protein insertion efficiency factor YidD [Candidatus Yanofskybacteria bacterium]|nr:membrane protein insertion efficiency factor YidD [Candidatus Yanofskybacteria bacterium]